MELCIPFSSHNSAREWNERSRLTD